MNHGPQVNNMSAYLALGSDYELKQAAQVTVVPQAMALST